MPSFQETLLRDVAPSLDVTANGKLHPKGKELARLFKPKSQRERAIGTIARETWTMTQTIFRTRHIGNSLVDGIRLSRIAWKRWRFPHDTDFLTGADPGMKETCTGVFGGLLNGHSRIANPKSQAHLLEAEDYKNGGESLTIEMFPHTSLMDPFAVQAMFRRIAESGSQPAGLRAAAERVLDNMVVMIGQKVGISHQQRMFMAAYHTLLTIAPKYHAVAPEFSRAHSSVAGHIAQGIRAHPDWRLLMFPEAARTKEKRIGVHKLIPMAMPECAWHLPMYLKIPPRLFDPDHGFRAPSDVDARLFIGKPFQLRGIRRREKATAYVHMTRQRLADVGAPVGNHEWGVFEPREDAAPSHAELVQSGWPETFVAAQD